MSNASSSLVNIEVNVNQPEQVKQPNADLVYSEIKENEEAEQSFQFSPTRVKEAYNQNRAGMKSSLMERTQEIEENLDLGNTKRKTIDFSIIEALKARRLQQEDRRSGEDLEKKREEIIKQVEKQMRDRQTL